MIVAIAIKAKIVDIITKIIVILILFSYIGK